MNQSSTEFLELFKKRAGIDRRVDSEHHSHSIVPWAVEEKCYFCKYPASHKVAEDGANPHIHPLTAYVCCDHFWGGCNNTKVIVKDHGNYQMTVPNEVPSKRPDPVGPTEAENLAEDSEWRYRYWDYDG